MIPLAILLFSAGADPARITPHVAPATPVETRAALDALVQLPGTSPAWTLASELPCKFWPATDGTCRMTAATPGRYLVLAASGADVVRHVVIFEGPVPMPPGPGPGPAPVPVPPTPVPVPPTPADPLKLIMVTAFTADAGDAAQKKADALELAALYNAGADGCFLIAKDDLGRPILDAAGRQTFTYATPKLLLDAIRKVGNGRLADRLHGVRAAFQVELQSLLKNTTDPFTDASRKATADLFKRAETILEGLGK